MFQDFEEDDDEFYTNAKNSKYEVQSKSLFDDVDNISQQFTTSYRDISDINISDNTVEKKDEYMVDKKTYEEEQELLKKFQTAETLETKKQKFLNSSEFQILFKEKCI